MRFISRDLLCKLTSFWAFVQGRSRICTDVDYQTLFTHNHTIISFSLKEGLTYNHCAYHALARCHKKYDCGYESSIQIIFNESFKSFFAFTVIKLIAQFNLIQFYCLIYMTFTISVRVARSMLFFYLKTTKYPKLNFINIFADPRPLLIIFRALSCHAETALYLLFLRSGLTVFMFILI